MGWPIMGDRTGQTLDRQHRSKKEVCRHFDNGRAAGRELWPAKTNPCMHLMKATRKHASLAAWNTKGSRTWQLRRGDLH